MSNELTASFPILGIAAWSGTGKTTLLEKLLPLLAAYGLKVAVIKHAHHSFEGFKAWPIPKLVIYRDGVGDSAILTDPWVEAVALSAPSPIDLTSCVAQLNLDDSDAIARWIVTWINAKNQTVASKKER